MTRSKLLLLLAIIAATALAGCGTPDEQEADESPQSEQESVGEGEVPGIGVVGGVLAVAVAAVLVARRR